MLVMAVRDANLINSPLYTRFGLVSYNQGQSSRHVDTVAAEQSAEASTQSWFCHAARVSQGRGVVNSGETSPQGRRI